MGTRSMVFVMDDTSRRCPNIIAQIYSQYDGYPQGMGQLIYNFLVNRTMTNGFVKKDINISNGMEDLAAQLVMYLKTPNITGNIYLYPVAQLPKHKQSLDDYIKSYMLEYAWGCVCEYIYIINRQSRELEVRVFGSDDKPLFIGPPRRMKDAFDLEAVPVVIDSDGLW